MELKDFDELEIHDFDNGAVIDSIRDTIRERDELRGLGGAVRLNCGILDETCADCEDKDCSLNQ